jgi:hypothetical protein
MTITFFGVKNDTDRSGFEVRIPHGPIAKTDPVRTLQHYVQRSDPYRCGQKPLFISLRPPYGALNNKTIGEILKGSIKDAGLQGYTPRSFRTTGATAAVHSDVDPGTARQIGRWKNNKIFYERYVYTCAPEDYCAKVLSYKGLNVNK